MEYGVPIEQFSYGIKIHVKSDYRSTKPVHKWIEHGHRVPHPPFIYLSNLEFMTDPHGGFSRGS